MNHTSPLPHVSPEADRRVYEALKNVRRLNDYRRERERLERVKDRLAHAVVTHHRAEVRTLDQVRGAVFAGHRALERGTSYDCALKVALLALGGDPCTA